jgi:hypothetical protein
MSTATPSPFVNRATGAALVFVVVTGVLLGVTMAVRLAVPAPAVDADRAAIRYKALADMRAAEETNLNTAGWVDQDRNIVRLPVDVAIHVAAQAWQNPEKARADLIARAAKATAPLPKVAPKPSAFE